MVSETKISKGYRTVVPAKLRKAHDISPSDRLVWEEEKGEIKIKVRKRKTLKDIAGMINVGGDAVEWKKKAQREEI
jgi:bifunctional DNA-binding transcriptional regulator/antitoxin component of YhaV-PrlF toxin-antitoxin module